MTLTVEQVMTAAPVVPVMVIDKLEHAVPLAQALTRGGLKALEITLRTPVALDAIRAIKEAMPEAMVGAGTIVSERDLDAALEAGARFSVLSLRGTKVATSHISIGSASNRDRSGYLE